MKKSIIKAIQPAKNHIAVHFGLHSIKIQHTNNPPSIGEEIEYDTDHRNRVIYASISGVPLIKNQAARQLDKLAKRFN
jgi:hypothetical protein